LAVLFQNIPYHYIPFEVHNHFNKKLLFAGSHSRYDTTYIMGSVEDWDFVVFYADDDNIVGVSASPSRQK
jgi:lipocalin